MLQSQEFLIKSDSFKGKKYFSKKIIRNDHIRITLLLIGWPLLNRISIGWQVILAFSLVIIMSTITTLVFKFNSIQGYSYFQDILKLRMGVLDASSNALIGIQKSLAGLRGYLLFRDGVSVELRKEAWVQIQESLRELETLSGSWDHPDRVIRLKELGEKLAEFQSFQTEMMSLPEEEVQNALNLLKHEAAPHARSATKILDEMLAEQRRLLDKEMKLAEKLTFDLRNLLWLLLSLNIFLGLIIAFYISWRVRSSLNAASNAANDISEGGFDTPINFAGSIEILQLSDSLRSMRDIIRNREWLVSQQISFLKTISGADKIFLLGECILEQCFDKTSASIGAFFYLEEGELKPVAALSQEKKLSHDELNIMSNLANQAIRTKKIVHNRNLSHECFTIRTTLSSDIAYESIMIPIFYNNSGIGLIELAAAKEFSELELDFLQGITDSVGIAINLCLSTEQTVSLLDEIKKQSQELEQTNIELERSASELELQQQELEQSNRALEESQSKLEEERRNLEEINVQLARSQRELKLSAEQANTANKYKTEFLANMSHEFRTPLNSIMLLSTLLADNQDNNLTEIQIKNAMTIHNAGRDLLRLINNILDLSKVEAGELEIIRNPVTVQVILKEIDQMFRTQVESKGLRFSTNADPELPEMITTDQKRVEQIIRNFVSNSLKFTETGCIEISAFRDSSGQFVVFEVKDSGIGIPENRLGLIFEAFKQIDGTLTRKAAGTGLGLSISKALALRLNGKINVTSIEGVGSIFTLSLPMDEGENSNVKNAVAPFTETKRDDARVMWQMQQGALVLIIEDDPVFADAVKQKCEKRHYVVKLAISASQGREMIKNLKPSVVILDINLPDGSGLELLHDLKTDKHTRDIPVHVMSAENHEKSSLQQGAHSFIEKPATQSGLEDALDRVGLISAREAKNVLIVEDDEDQLRHLSSLVKKCHAVPSEARSVEGALKAMENHHYDCMILDLNLTDGTGFDLVKLMRRNRREVDVPVIIYTSKGLTPEEEKQLESFSRTVVLKRSNSDKRLIREVGLFLHSVEAKNISRQNPRKRKVLIGNEVLHGKRVLVVDDDNRNVYSLSMTLASWGMQSVEANNGKEALEILSARSDIDIVLMDIMMPVMNGFDAIKQIKQNTAIREIPVIALTAKAMKKDREDCLASGANDYVTKPIDPSILHSVLRVWLSGEKGVA